MTFRAILIHLWNHKVLSKRAAAGFFRSDWDDVWRRNQFLCAAYASRHPERRILFVGLALDVSNRVRRGRFSELLGSTTYKAPGFDNITITHPIKLFPDSFTVTRKANEAMMRRRVRKVAKSLGLKTPVLWLNPHSAVHMVGRMGESAAIYDITDDWTALTQSQAAGARVKAQDAKLCGRADAVIVCSQRLYEMKRPVARRLRLIPNGVDADHYRAVFADVTPISGQAANWARPVLGYTGTIHPDRVDVELLAALAKTWAGSVVLIGLNHLKPVDLAKLEFPNLHFTGAVPYAKLPDLMRGFDVCVVPHRVTPFTESLNPIKLWEYLAAGKPIVATEVAGCRDFPQYVRIAHGVEEFVQAARAALDEGTSVGEQRQHEAARHSWQARLDDVEEVMNEAVAARSDCQN